MQATLSARQTRSAMFVQMEKIRRLMGAAMTIRPFLMVDAQITPVADAHPIGLVWNQGVSARIAPEINAQAHLELTYQRPGVGSTIFALKGQRQMLMVAVLKIILAREISLVAFAHQPAYRCHSQTASCPEAVCAAAVLLHAR